MSHWLERHILYNGGGRSYGGIITKGTHAGRRKDFGKVEGYQAASEHG